MAPGEYLAGKDFKLPTLEEYLKISSFRSLPQTFDHFDGSQSSLPGIQLPGPDITRWEMAWRAIQAFKSQGPDVAEIRTNNALTSRCKDWSDMDDIFDKFSVAFDYSEFFGKI